MNNRGENMKTKRILLLILAFTLIVFAAPIAGITQSVYADGFAFETSSYEFSICDEDARVYTNSYEEVAKWESSDESVASISYDESYFAFLDIKGIGKTTITATSYFGSIATCTVTVTEDEWYLEKTKLDAKVSDEYLELPIRSASEYNSFTATVSNTKVATVTVNYDYIGIDVQDAGTATITVKDKFGKSATAQLTVKPDPISFGENSTLNLDDYEMYDTESTEFGFDTNGENYIASVKSSNESVAKVKRHKDTSSSYEYYYFELIPVGAGSATITATDQYGQVATMTVTITQKYIDESKYLEDLRDCYVENLEYGNTRIVVQTSIAPKVYTVIKGRTYNGSVDEDGDYIIRGIPKLPAGSKITVHLEKGQAKYDHTIKVEKKAGRDLTVKVKAQNYTGKALKPKVTIKQGKYILKKGTDYTVKYSNNKKIGRAKVTVTFKGNYKGAKAAYFNIRPKGTTITKVSPIKDGFKVKWKKRTSQVSGYQIQYGWYRDPIEYGQKKTIKGNKTDTLKIYNLWGDKYQVRIRTFKIVKGKKYYSSWSKVKQVKPKH